MNGSGRAPKPAVRTPAAGAMLGVRASWSACRKSFFSTSFRRDDRSAPRRPASLRPVSDGIRGVHGRRREAADAAHAGIPHGRQPGDDRQPACAILEVGQHLLDRLEARVREGRPRPQVRILGEDGRDLPVPADRADPQDGEGHAEDDRDAKRDPQAPEKPRGDAELPETRPGVRQEDDGVLSFRHPFLPHKHTHSLTPGRPD